MAVTKRTRAAGESITLLLVVGGILILLNVLGVFVFARWDSTEKELFSLSEGSKRLARSLKDRMEITAYFTGDLPAPYNETERSTKDLLEEYQSASGGKITVRFVDPDTDKEREAAQSDGVQRVQHQHIENDNFAVIEGYRGLAIKYLGESKAIPVIRDETGLEYTITQTMKELAGDRRPVGIVSGHEGPTLGQGLSGLRDTLPTYDLREISANEQIPSELAAVLVIGPQTPFSDVELRRLNQYFMHGGSLGVFGGGIKLTLEGEAAAEPVDTKLNTLLSKWGVRIEGNVVADAQCGRAPMRGPLGLTMAVPYPPVPIVGFDEKQREHPAVFRLDSIVFPFTSSLTLTGALRGDRNAKLTTLAKSSENSWLLTDTNIPLRPRMPQEWQLSGKTGPFALAVAVEGELPSAYASAPVSTASSAPGNGGIEAPDRSTKKARLLVSGSSGVLRDEFLPPPGESGERDLTGALAFALNAIDWLAQDSDLIAVRAKNVEDPALNVPNVQAAEEEARTAAQAQNREGVEKAIKKHKAALEEWEATKDVYRWANTLGIPAAFALFGVARWRFRKAKKQSLKLS